MVWLPDLHPRNVVALNRKALQAVFSNIPYKIREGRRVLSELTRHRLPLEERFGGWRPADYADALKRFPPVIRDDMRQKMNGVALILTPDSVTDSDVLSEIPQKNSIGAAHWHHCHTKLKRTSSHRCAIEPINTRHLVESSLL